MGVILVSCDALARSCPMPSLQEEFDDSFAIVRAEPVIELPIGSDDLLILVRVKSVYKGSHLSWGLWSAPSPNPFNVRVGEDGVWFLRWRIWGLPRMTDCGHSASVSNATVMAFLVAQGAPRLPDTIAPFVAFFALFILTILVLVVRRIRSAVQESPRNSANR
jgi:hypothetical protein